MKLSVISVCSNICDLAFFWHGGTQGSHISYCHKWLNHLVLVLFQTGAAGGMSSNITPMSRSGMESMGGNYAGTSDMINNGLNANQNQVSFK